MRRYAVIKKGRTIESLLEALEDAFDELQRDGRTLFALEGSETRPGARVHVWREQWRGDARVELVDDDELPARYLVVETPDAGEAGRVLAAVARHLPLETLAHLRDAARKHAQEDPATLVRMALAEDATPARETVELIRAHLGPDTPIPLRNAAVMAADLLRSPDLLGALELLRDAVSDERERRVVEQAIHDSRERQA